MAEHGGVRRGALLRTAVLALLWGSTFLWIKVALTGLEPAHLTAIRCALGTAVLAALCRYAGQRLPGPGRIWAHLAVAAFFCNALPFVLFSLGEQSVDSGVAGVLNATTPLWSLLIGFAIGTERGAGPLRLGGLLLGFAGVLLIFAPWAQHALASWGSVAFLGAAASYAVGFTYMGRFLVGRDRAPLALAAAQLLAATAWTSLAVPVAGLPQRPGATALVAVVILGTACTGVTFYLSLRLVAEEGATNAATVGYLLPVVSVTLGALVLGEPLHARVVAGMVVVLVGVSLTRWRPARPAPAHQPQASPPAHQPQASPPAHQTPASPPAHHPGQAGGETVTYRSSRR